MLIAQVVGVVVGVVVRDVAVRRRLMGVEGSCRLEGCLVVVVVCLLRAYIRTSTARD